MTEQQQRLHVKDVYDPKRMNSLIVREDESLINIVKELASHPGIRGIFVINEDEKLTGVITRTELLNYAKGRMGKNMHLLPLRSLFLRHLKNARAKDFTHPLSYKAYVTPDDDLLKGLKLMLETGLVDVPVCDKRGRILGDLKLSEILLRVLKWKECTEQ